MYKYTFKELITNFPVSQEDMDFFASMPFARPYLDKSSTYQPIPFVTRYDKGDSSNQFFNKTIKSEDTIPLVLAFIRKPGSSQHDPPTDDTNNAAGKDPLSQAAAESPFFVTFCQLEPGVNGYLDTMHGGVLASLFDEALGLCAEAYRVIVSEDTGILLTVNLEVSYRSPVATPSAVVIQTWVRKIEGRKWFLEAKLLDQNGLLKAEAKSLYIKMKSAL